MEKTRKKPQTTTAGIAETIARAFARGRICRSTAEYFGISLGQALDVLGDLDQWRVPTSELQD